MRFRFLSVFLLLLGACASEPADEAAETTQGELTATGDRRDPAAATEDRIAAETTVWQRRIALHVSDRDNASWASIDNGDPSDEVWLDRSFDGGVAYDGKLGQTKIPNGKRGWRTMMYSVDDASQRLVGVVRACGKAANRSEVACTPWQRTKTNAATTIDAAATGLMELYDPHKGLWRSIGWWNSANALTALIDFSEKTGSQAYRYAIAKTFDQNRRDDFTNEYMDDTAWWGLAWVRAFDLTHDRRYLDMAKRDADYLWSFHDDRCGGGVWWRKDKTYKNAITNELFIKLAASIHNRLPGDVFELERAKSVYRWFEASGMINAQGLVNDGLDLSTCKNNGQTTWTYNQGVLLGGLVELHRATKNRALLDRARALADASTSRAELHPNGILREPCESSSDACGPDGPSFKGIYVRNLAELDRALDDHPYRSYLERQASSLVAKAKGPLDHYGVHWAGPFDKADGARQQSALDLLTAARR